MRSVLGLAVGVVLAACSTPPPGGGGGGFVLSDLGGGGFDAGASKADTGEADTGKADTGKADATGQVSDASELDDTTATPDDAEAPAVDVEEDAPDLAGFFDDDTGANAGDCAAGQILCAGKTAKTCDGKGGFSQQEECPDACVVGKGCAACVPNSTTCTAKSAQKCKADGSGWESFNCDAELGFSCDEATGKCTGACAIAEGARSYIGCEYWPTVTSNSLLYSGFSFAVAIANTTGKPAEVTIRKGGAIVQKVQVAADSVQTVKLPWVADLKHDGSKASTKAAIDASVPSALVTDGAYQLKSTQPVTVYQFNPLEFEIPLQSGCSNPLNMNACNSYTNDASLLLPTSSLGKEYLVAALPGSGFKPLGQPLTSRPGFVAIVATQDKTAVHIDSKAAVRAGPGVNAIAAGKGADFTLNQGDVLQLMIAPMTDSTPMTCGATLPNLAKDRKSVV